MLFRSAIETPGPDGALRVRVTAPAEDGRANAAVMALLARAWRLPKSALAIVGGQTSRTKRILVRGPAEQLTRQIAAAVPPPP